MSFADLSTEIAEEFDRLQVFDRTSLAQLSVDRRGTSIASATTFTRKSNRKNTRLTHMHTQALLTPSTRRVPGLARGMTPAEYWRWYKENAIKASPERLEHERAKRRRHQLAAIARRNLAAGRPLTSKQRVALERGRQ